MCGLLPFWYAIWLNIHTVQSTVVRISHSGYSNLSLPVKHYLSKWFFFLLQVWHSAASLLSAALHLTVMLIRSQSQVIWIARLSLYLSVSSQTARQAALTSVLSFCFLCLIWNGCIQRELIICFLRLVLQHLVGRLIGKQGRYVSFLKQSSGAKIYISTLPYTQEFQICHMEGKSLW